MRIPMFWWKSIVKSTQETNFVCIATKQSYSGFKTLFQVDQEDWKEEIVEKKKLIWIPCHTGEINGFKNLSQ